MKLDFGPAVVLCIGLGLAAWRLKFPFPFDIDYFLNIPVIGFPLYMTFGGSFPAFLDNEAFAPCLVNSSDCNWLVPNSVIVTPCGKCGTNWMLTIVHELRSWNLSKDLQEFEDIMDITPWPELRHYPHESYKERIANWGTQWNDTRYPFRAFKSHLSPERIDFKSGKSESWLPMFRKDVKYLAMARNPLDSLTSFTTFVQKHDPGFTNLWGQKDFQKMTLENLFDVAIVKDNMNVFGYLKSWHDHRSDDNVLFLHYNQALQDLNGVIRKIASFVGMDVKAMGDKAIAEVEKRCTFSFMKERNDKYLYKAGPKNTLTILSPGVDAMVNKGGKGRFEEVLSQEQIDFIRNKMKTLLGESLAHFAETGEYLKPT